MRDLKEEIGKLRHEVKVGFIEVDNQFQLVNDRLDTVGSTLQKTIEGLQKISQELQKTNEQVRKTQSQIGKIAKLMDNGFEVIQTFMDQKIEQQEIRLSNVEQRLDRAGL